MDPMGYRIAPKIGAKAETTIGLYPVNRRRFQFRASNHVQIQVRVTLARYKRPKGLNHWGTKIQRIGLRENLQETMVFTIKYKAFL